MLCSLSNLQLQFLSELATHYGIKLSNPVPCPVWLSVHASILVGCLQMLTFIIFPPTVRDKGRSSSQNTLRLLQTHMFFWVRPLRQKTRNRDEENDVVLPWPPDVRYQNQVEEKEITALQRAAAGEFCVPMKVIWFAHTWFRLSMKTLFCM